MKYNAILHGAKEEDFETQPDGETIRTSTSSEGNKIALFEDPSIYDHLPEEKRKELTAKMMGTHKRWSDNKLKV